MMTSATEKKAWQSRKRKYTRYTRVSMESIDALWGRYRDGKHYCYYEAACDAKSVCGDVRPPRYRRLFEYSDNGFSEALEWLFVVTGSLEEAGAIDADPAGDKL
jgi:hypothetical protein